MDAADEDLKAYALRHGVSVTLSNGRTYNASGARMKRQLKVVATAAVEPEDAPPAVETPEPKAEPDPRIAMLESAVTAINAELRSLREQLAQAVSTTNSALAALQKREEPKEQLAPVSFVFDVQKRDADGYIKTAALRPVGSEPETLESRVVQRVQSRA